MTTTYPKPNFLAVCSCGKRAIIYYDHETDDFVPSDSSWLFVYQSEVEPYDTRGWNCGQAGHTSHYINHSQHELDAEIDLATATKTPQPAPIKKQKPKTKTETDDKYSLF